MHSINYRMNRLKARVVAMNRCHKAMNELYPLLAVIFAPLVGQKILKADGSLLAKYAAHVKPIMDKFNTGNELSVWHASDNRYSLLWNVKVCENMPDDGTCVYEESSLYVGSTNNGMCDSQSLKELHPADVHRTDYTVKEILELRADYETKKEATEDARSALHPFGERDR